MTRHAPTLFESFNARALQPGEVARTFVPFEAYDQLCLRRHSVVLGPRGSGKTTLLKMLEPVALEAWEHAEADRYAESIDFTAVFVPFDRSWQAQMASASAAEADLRDGDSVLNAAAFSTHLFHCLVTTMLHRLSTDDATRRVRRVRSKPEINAELAAELANIWRVPLRGKSLLALRVALSNQLANIGMLARQLRYVSPESRRSRLEADEALFIPFVAGVVTALDVWESCTGTRPERWALACDELELAPASIKRTLFEAMRSVDGRLLFKLALSPYDDTLRRLSDASDPQAGQDYDEITLWFSEKREAEPFCRKLWSAMLADRKLPGERPHVAFGRSLFSTETKDWSNSEGLSAYGARSRASRSFQELAKIDPTFREYLERRDLKAERLDAVPSLQRPSTVRKIAPLVEYRLFFLRLKGAERAHRSDRDTELRSRKRLTLYTGWETLCAVSEGNPRWFIGIVSELLREARPGDIRVSKRLQASAIADASRRYRAALRTIPVAQGDARRRSRGLLSVLEAIAEYCRIDQLERPFSAEPVGSFVVDSRVPESLAVDIAQALNAGALVHIPTPHPETSTMDVRGKRYRLCYLLAASESLMPRIERHVNLSTIVSTSRFASLDVLELPLGETQA